MAASLDSKWCILFEKIYARFICSPIETLPFRKQTNAMDWMRLTRTEDTKSTLCIPQKGGWWLCEVVSIAFDEHGDINEGADYVLQNLMIRLFGVSIESVSTIQFPHSRVKRRNQRRQCFVFLDGVNRHVIIYVLNNVLECPIHTNNNYEEILRWEDTSRREPKTVIDANLRSNLRDNYVDMSIGRGNSEETFIKKLKKNDSDVGDRYNDNRKINKISASADNEYVLYESKINYINVRSAPNNNNNNDNDDDPKLRFEPNQIEIIIDSSYDLDESSKNKRPSNDTFDEFRKHDTPTLKSEPIDDTSIVRKDTDRSIFKKKRDEITMKKNVIHQDYEEILDPDDPSNVNYVSSSLESTASSSSASKRISQTRQISSFPLSLGPNYTFDKFRNISRSRGRGIFNFLRRSLGLSSSSAALSSSPSSSESSSSSTKSSSMTRKDSKTANSKKFQNVRDERRTISSSFSEARSYRKPSFSKNTERKTINYDNIDVEDHTRTKINVATTTNLVKSTNASTLEDSNVCVNASADSNNIIIVQDDRATKEDYRKHHHHHNCYQNQDNSSSNIENVNFSYNVNINDDEKKSKVLFEEKDFYSLMKASPFIVAFLLECEIRRVDYEVYTDLFCNITVPRETIEYSSRLVDVLIDYIRRGYWLKIQKNILNQHIYCYRLGHRIFYQWSDRQSVLPKGALRMHPLIDNVFIPIANLHPDESVRYNFNKWDYNFTKFEWLTLCNFDIMRNRIESYVKSAEKYTSFSIAPHYCQPSVSTTMDGVLARKNEEIADTSIGFNNIFYRTTRRKRFFTVSGTSGVIDNMFTDGYSKI